MRNFNIILSNPYMLLIIIPAVLFTLYTYLRLNKRFRLNRNRITSIVLHSIVMLLAILVLSGMKFQYEVPNDDIETIILVDMSQSNEDSKDECDELVKQVIEANAKGFKIGVVTFGYDQVYASPLSFDQDEVYQNYINATLPNISSTNLEDALNFAQSKLKNPKTSKIVLLSDGIETDGTAMTAIANIALSGTKVDTFTFAHANQGDVQILSANIKQDNVVVDAEFTFNLVVQSTFSGEAIINFYDDVNSLSKEPAVVHPFTLRVGNNKVEFNHTFETSGLHQLYFEVINANGISGKFESVADTIEDNNYYFSYVFLEEFKDILIIDRDNESRKLVQLLNDSEFIATSRDIMTFDMGIQKPASVENDYTNEDYMKILDMVTELRSYDQIILQNIANSDLPEAFDLVLKQYVYEFGGGLLTIGGSDGIGDDSDAHSYNENDMAGTLYQQMLPVIATPYQPPMALVILIDTSGSMTAMIEEAKKGALTVLNSLGEDDYCGVYSIADESSLVANLMPLTQKNLIIKSINELESGGGTVYTDSIVSAGTALKAVKNVKRKHIIVISDAQPGDTFEQYSVASYNNFDNGITMSIVNIASENVDNKLEEVANNCGGNFYAVKSTNLAQLATYMTNDLASIRVTGTNQTIDPFNIEFALDSANIYADIDIDGLPKITGYYGVVPKSTSTVYLETPDYAPLYADWKYGNGKVGSYMSDLNGNWSSELMTEEEGIKLISNMVKGLFPMSDISPKSFSVKITRKNFNVEISFSDTELANKGDKIILSVTPYSNRLNTEADKIIKTYDAKVVEKQPMEFELNNPGIYKIEILKMDANDGILGRHDTYIDFSYSLEYNQFVDGANAVVLMSNIASATKGIVVEQDKLDMIFSNFAKYLQKEFDPRYLFIIIAIVLFLLDIAVRKFKFKWPHELYREYKMKRHDK